MADTQRDYYEVLGVPRDADEKAIRSAFRRLARKYHPDRSADPDAGERFQEIAEAYRVLSDPDSRAAYDRSGFAGVAGMTPEEVWSGIDFSDLFGMGGPEFGEILFERLFGRPGRPGPQRGADVETTLAIPLAIVATGGAQDVEIAMPGPCPVCSGSGARPGTAPRPCPACGGAGQQRAATRHGNVLAEQVRPCPDCGGCGSIIDELCPQCRGSGQAVLRHTVAIRVPPGVPDGATFRLSGHGMPAPAPGGAAGDAYVTVRAAPDPRLSRRGEDLWCEIGIPVADAVLGTATTVPALDGEVEVTIPAGTQPGAVLALPGKGLPRYQAPGRGDLKVVVGVRLPTVLSPRQRRLYEQLREDREHQGTVRQAGSHAPGRRSPRRR